MTEGSDRKAKGANLIGLVKLLRSLRKTRRLPTFSSATEAVLQQRILLTEWYPLEVLVELVEFTYVNLLDRDDDKAYEVGAAGGRTHLAGAHKALLDTKDPVGSVLAMRLSWRLTFNFGELYSERNGDDVVRFRLVGYEDVLRSHALMIAGWGAAGGQMVGAPRSRAQIVSMPSPARPELLYDVAIKR